jgi:AraC-like DNA-binding protein
MNIHEISFCPLRQESIEAHQHDAAEWHYIIEGQCGFRVKDQRYEIRTGDLLVIPPGLEHGVDIASEDEWLLQYVVVTDPDLEWLRVWGTGADRDFPSRAIGSGKHGTFARLQHDIDSGQIWRQRAASHRFEALLCTAMASADQPGLSVSRHPAVDQALALMRQGLRNRLSMHEIASAVGLDRHYLTRLFTAQVGMAPMACFTDLKMQLATAMLQASDEAISTIAAKLAYDDPFHFSRVFRCWSGMAPSRWRKENAVRD